MNKQEKRRKCFIYAAAKQLFDAYEEMVLPAFQEGLISGDDYKGFTLRNNDKKIISFDDGENNFDCDIAPVVKLINKEDFGVNNPLGLSCLCSCAETAQLFSIAQFANSVKQDIEYRRIEKSIEEGTCDTEKEYKHEEFLREAEDQHYYIKNQMGGRWAPFMTDNTLDDYYIWGELWESGAFGTVCLADDKNNNTVALKRINMSHRPVNQQVDYLFKYCSLFDKNPNLVSIFDIGVDHIDATKNLSVPFLFYTMEAADNILYGLNKQITYELGDGIYIPYTFSNVMKYVEIEAKELIIILRQLLNGIKALHDKGFAHRDIKPDNIIFVNGIPKLADICMISNNDVMSLVGTPGFLPNEYIETDILLDCRVDLYALGMTAYCGFTGLSPSDYPNIPFEKLDTVEGRKLKNIIFKACAPKISKRFQTADEFLEAIKD